MYPTLLLLEMDCTSFVKCVRAQGIMGSKQNEITVKCRQTVGTFLQKEGKR